MSGPPDNPASFYDFDRAAPPRCRCGHPSATLDLYNGRRCLCCHPAYDAGVTSALRATGWPDTASAYKRTYDRGAQQ